MPAGKQERYMSAYPSLAVAIAQLNSGDTLIIDRASTISSNETIPATAHVRFEKAGLLTISDTYTLTIDASIEAGNFQIFDCSACTTSGGVVIANHGVSNVMWFGAAGDGTTNDKPEFQFASDALTSGGTFFVPGGNIYLITPVDDGSGTLVGFTIGDDITLSMYGAELKTPADVGDDDYQIIQCKDSERIRLMGGIITGDAPGNTSAGNPNGMGLALWGCLDFTVKDMHIRDCWGDSIYVRDGSASASGDQALGCVQGSITDCKLEGSRRQGISVVGGMDISIKGNTIRDIDGANPQSGIDLEPSAGDVVQNVSVIDNHVDNTIGAGIIAQGATGLQPTDCVISGNTTRDTGDEGIRVKGQRITVANNSIYNPTNEGINFEDSQRCIAIGNMVEGGASHAIRGATVTTQCTDLLIKGNSVESCTLDGINVTGVEDFIVEGNFVQTSRSGIAITKNGSFANGPGIVKGNLCHDNEEEGIFCTSNDDILVDGNTCHSNGTLTDATYSNIKFVYAGGTGAGCMCANNICRQGSNGNKPQYGLHIGASVEITLGPNELSDSGTIGCLYNEGTIFGEVNARWFGAVGDGTTDDTTFIQNALDNSDAVYLPAGTYIFERLVMNTVNHLRGDGPGITILKQDAETVAPDAQGIGVVDSATWYEVRDLEIDGNAANQSWYSAASPTAENGHGISICSGVDCGGLTVYPEHVEVHNVYAHDMTRNPFLINGDVVNCSNLTAKNSYGDHLFYVSASEHGNFVNIHCRGYWSSGAMALEGVNVTNLTFDDIAENPDNPTNTLGHYIGTRNANSLRGTNILNVTAEFDPSLSADYFLVSEGAARISQVELDAVSTNTGEFDFFRTGGTVASRVVVNGLYARDVYDGFSLVATGSTAADLIEFDHVQIEYNAAVIAAVDLCYIECVLDRLAITNLKTYGGDAAELVRLGTVAEVKDLFIENVSMTSVGTYIVVNANDIGRLWMAHCDFDGTATLRGLVSVSGTGDTLDEAMIQDVHITNSSSYGPFSFAAGTVVGPVTCIRLTADATGDAIPDSVSLLDCDITGDSVGKLQVNKSGDAVEMVLDRTDTLSAAANVASLTAKGRDNAGGENDYGEIRFYAGTVTAGGEDGEIQFWPSRNGVLEKRFAVVDGRVDQFRDGGPVNLHVYRTDTLSDGDVVYQLRLYGDDDAGGETEYARMTTDADDASAGAEGGSFSFKVANANASGAITQVIKIDQKGSTASKGGHIDAVQTVTGTSITVDCEDGLVVRLDPLTGATTFNTPTNPTDGAVLKFRIQQDGAGGAYGVTFGSVFKLAGGSYTMSTGNDQVDTVCFVYDDTDSAWYETSRAQNLS